MDGNIRKIYSGRWFGHWIVYCGDPTGYIAGVESSDVFVSHISSQFSARTD